MGEKTERPLLEIMAQRRFYDAITAFSNIAIIRHYPLITSSAQSTLTPSFVPFLLHFSAYDTFSLYSTLLTSTLGFEINTRFQKTLINSFLECKQMLHKNIALKLSLI